MEWRGIGDMTAPQAVVVGAAIIAAAVVGSRLLAPYEFAAGPGPMWRLNTVTGDICNYNATCIPKHE
jgi:hypothetical protein